MKKAVGLFKLSALMIAVAPFAAHSAIYQFNFTANPGADGTVAANVANDINYTFTANTALTNNISLNNLNQSEYWANGGYTLEMSHNGKTIRLNDAITSTTGPLQMGVGAYGIGDGFIEIYSPMSEFFDIDFHPGAAIIDSNGLSYNAFVYGQIDVYNHQQQFQDLYSIAVNGDTSKLQQYMTSSIPEPSAWYMGLAGAAVLLAMRSRKSRRVRA